MKNEEINNEQYPILFFDAPGFPLEQPVFSKGYNILFLNPDAETCFVFYENKNTCK